MVPNSRYVRMMQTAIADSITQHQRGEDGAYGRRTSSKHIVHDVFLLPHLYGSLTQHKDGFSILMQHDAVRNMVQVSCLLMDMKDNPIAGTYSHSTRDKWYSLSQKSLSFQDHLPDVRV